MALTLVILAAGLGSRFGGGKALAAVGPDGQALFEYSVYDAFHAGFNHVIFVVSEEQNTAEISNRLHLYGDALKVEFVVQSVQEFVPPSIIKNSPTRKKPWGTAHAVLVCRNYIRNPFVVINADDYYGQGNYQSVGRYLLDNERDSKTCVLPGYQLENTLSSSGGVNRGLCEVDSQGYLKSIREVKNIQSHRSDQSHQSILLRYDETQPPVFVTSNSIVSMTFWGAMPAIFDLFEVQFRLFLNDTPNLAQDEFYIPDTINSGIKSEALRVRLLSSNETWKGITYAEDIDDVKEFILKLCQSGMYSDIGNSRAH